MSVPTVTPEEVDSPYDRLKKEAEAGGYHLNPDPEFARALVRGSPPSTRRAVWISRPDPAAWQRA